MSNRDEPTKRVAIFLPPGEWRSYSMGRISAKLWYQSGAVRPSWFLKACKHLEGKGIDPCVRLICIYRDNDLPTIHIVVHLHKLLVLIKPERGFPLTKKVKPAGGD